VFLKEKGLLMMSNQEMVYNCAKVSLYVSLFMVAYRFLFLYLGIH